MIIAIATDHRGIEIKKEIIKILQSNNYQVLDCSPINTPTDDYPDFAFKVAETIQKKSADLGILLCGSGIGMSIAANKVKGIRCAKVGNVEEAKYTRLDNNSNIISLSTQIPMAEIEQIIKIFITTEFSEEQRHIDRINKITAYEQGKYYEL